MVDDEKKIVKIIIIYKVLRQPERKPTHAKPNQQRKTIIYVYI